MKVTNLTVENFRGISHMELQFQPGINILIGGNGAGKSSVLEVLAILLSRLTGRIQSHTGTGRFFSEYDIKIGATETVNSIIVEFMGQSFQWRVTKTGKGKRKQAFTDLAEVKTIVDQVHSLLVEGAGVPLVVIYSVNRAVLNIPLRIKTRHDFSQLEAYDQALASKEPIAFRLFFEWFRQHEDLENESLRYFHDIQRPPDWEYPDRQLEAVREAISAIMPGYGNLRVRRKPLSMTLEKNGLELRVDQLSDGEKCFLALVGDIARRLAIANPAMEKPLGGEGIILIDEIELHLHPGWQRRVIPKLVETFPNCQFIISTHSPQVISHVRAESVFLLSVNQDTIELSRPEATYGQESGSILEDLMGVPARPKEIKDELNMLFVSIDEGNLAQARTLIEDLKEKLSFDAELIKAEVLLKRKEFLGQ